MGQGELKTMLLNVFPRGCGKSMAVGALLSLASIGCNAATFTVLHSFGIPHCQGSSPDGAGPGGVILGSDGLIHGITGFGPFTPVVYNGSIFSIDPVSESFQTSFGFSATTDGAWPSGVLTQISDGSYYGTANFSGDLPGISGTVFHYVPAMGISTVYAFAPAFNIDVSSANADGANPDSGVAFGADGTLWGTTRNGGADGNGTVFHLDPSTHQLTTIHSFSIRGGAQNAGSNADGANPVGKLVLAKDNNLYGVTTQGGPGQTGTIFQVNPGTGAFTILYGFAPFTDNTHNPDGANPSAGLTLASDGTLYGVTCSGGSGGGGTAFRFNPATRSLTTFSSFAPTSMACPTSSLLLASDGNFYGTTMRALNAAGAIFRMSSDGSVSMLHAFDETYTDPAGCNTYVNVEGTMPIGALVEDAKGDLIGSANSGGEGNSGTVFMLQGVVTASVNPGGGAPSSSGGAGALDFMSLALLASIAMLGKRRIRN
jgi:uncharacterized repeat protein (TIGR03803 family)